MSEASQQTEINPLETNHDMPLALLNSQTHNRKHFGNRNKSLEVLRHKRSNYETHDLRRVLMRRDRHQSLISEIKQQRSGSNKAGASNDSRLKPINHRASNSVFQISSKTMTKPSIGNQMSSEANNLVTRREYGLPIDE